MSIPLTREDLSLKPFCTPRSPSAIHGGEPKPLPKISTPVDDLPSVKRRFANTLHYEPEEALDDFLTVMIEKKLGAWLGFCVQSGYGMTHHLGFYIWSLENL